MPLIILKGACCGVTSCLCNVCLRSSGESEAVSWTKLEARNAHLINGGERVMIGNSIVPNTAYIGKNLNPLYCTE